MSISIRKEKDGLYRSYVYYYDKDHKRRGKSAGKFKRKKDAVASANELERELNQINLNLRDISLADYFKRWYETYKQASLADNTRLKYASTLEVINKYFKDKMLKDIRRSDYQQFINWYGSNHAMESVKKVHGHIRSCIGYAIDDDLISKDFTNRVQLVANKARERKPEYLTTSELTTFKDAVVSRLGGQSVSPYMILTAIYTGMRKSEIQALTWSDIDFMHGTISITKSWDDMRKKVKPTKNASSNRTIPVNRELLDKLIDLRANHSVMVFQNILGEIPTSNALNKMIDKTLASVGINKNYFTFHSLRHVHVAYLIGQGVDIYAISKRLGHSNVTTTLNTYSYLIDEYKAKNDNLIIKKLGAL
ncbi:MAG TPA: site-specific integrase [Ligilactobacillus saerimneri]|nr:site-specific integrase [Ligilactobacillus saerimneri]